MTISTSSLRNPGRVLLPAMLALASLVPAAAHALELTDLPSVVATANSCYLNSDCDPSNDWAAAKVLDGMDYDLTGAHSWNAGTWASAVSPQWVRLDFGNTYRLEGAELRFTYNGGAYTGFTNDYEFRTSVDGTSWAVSAGGTLIDSAHPAQLNHHWAWSPGDGPLARYVEYRVVGGSHWATLGELNVQGVAAPVPEPGTATMAMAGLLMCSLVARRRCRRV